jgi:Flp pilus assembly protein protease CpaA
MTPLTPAQIACLLVVTIAAITDLRSAKIRNWLTFPAAALGVALQWFQSGPAGAISAVEGCALGLGIGLALSTPFAKLLGWSFGGGDVKLMAAIGSLIGPLALVIALLYFSVLYLIFVCFFFGSALPWRGLSHAVPHFLRTRDISLLVGLDWGRLTVARKSKLLWGPFLAAGAALAIFFEQPAIIFLGLK